MVWAQAELVGQSSEARAHTVEEGVEVHGSFGAVVMLGGGVDDQRVTQDG